jgi:hypothetical protein
VKPIRILRYLSAAGGLGLASLTLSACDASPYAAKVNGQVITVNALNHQLSEFAANPGVVQGFSQGGGSVTGAGGSGTYSTKFVSRILGVWVEAAAVHQHVAASGRAPSADEVVAARAVDEFVYSPYWTSFSPSLRDFLVQGLADQGSLASPPADPSALEGPFQQIQSYLFSQVCVVQATAFDQSGAQSIAAQGVTQGAHTCYDQSGAEALPDPIHSAITKLANPGDVSQPVPTSYGFVVIRLVSRSGPGFDPDVQRVIVAATSGVPQVSSIVSAAHVKINPAYGSWANGQVNPPPAPLSS